MVAGSAGIYPPFATMAVRLQLAPIATMSIPGIRRLIQIAVRTRAVEAT